CVSFGVGAQGSPKLGIDFATAESVIKGAFTNWISVDCGGAFPSLNMQSFGAIFCNHVEANEQAANANAWIFRDDAWPYAPEGGFDGTYALSCTTFDITTGQIYDVDVEINSFGSQITVGDVNVGADLASIVTHEAGHFLGLEHSSVVGATMAPAYQLGDTSLRSLEPDDAAGLCGLYPPVRQAEPNPSCLPRQGFSRDCQSTGVAGAAGADAGSGGANSGTGGADAGVTPEPKESKGHGCSCRVPSSDAPRPVGVASAALLIACLLRRRRRA
ncbi:MAG TPA: matrixin family metalloprotease, partial [Polyangiaceae bacterium]